MNLFQIVFCDVSFNTSRYSSKMEDSQIEHINTNLYKLLKCTTCNTLLLVFMVENQILTTDDVDSLVSKAINKIYQINYHELVTKRVKYCSSTMNKFILYL